MKPGPRIGWTLIDEPRPSLCKHWMPKEMGHNLTHKCWCEPSLQGEPVPTDGSRPYTIVHHNDFAKA